MQEDGIVSDAQRDCSSSENLGLTLAGDVAVKVGI
jgi:hypothetical protein